MVAICSTIPLGFNQNGARPDPKDVGSLIATALSSNMYLNGLTAIDYMNFRSNLRPFERTTVTNSGKFKSKPKDKREWAHLHAAVHDDIDDQSIQLMLDPQRDCLNGKDVNLQHLEQQMLKTNDYVFSFVFSTLSHPEMIIALAKNLDENRYDVSSNGQNDINEELTILANKKREFFSTVDSEGKIRDNPDELVPDMFSL